MSAQIGESILYKGKKRTLFSEPLRSYLDQNPLLKFIPPHSACYRGYFADWEVNDGLLLLVKLEGYLANDKIADLHYLFPGEEKVFANWYSGELRIPQGEVLNYVHGGFSTVTSEDIFLTFENGKLVEEREVKNEYIDTDDVLPF